MDNGFGFRAFLAIGKDMGHDIMPDFFFFTGSQVKINIIGMLL